MEARNCESCGMPMNSEGDFGGGSIKNKYCRFCTDKEGNLKSYDEKVIDFTNFLQKSNDLNEEQANLMAKDILKEFPAWSDK